MAWNWKTAIDNARELAAGTEKSESPEQHIYALAKCVRDLCDAIEDLAQKVGVDAEED